MSGQEGAGATVATPRLGGLVVAHLVRAEAAFTRAAESLRDAAAAVRAAPVAGLDPDALTMLAAMTDASRDGLTRMEERVRQLLPSPRSPDAERSDA